MNKNIINSDSFTDNVQHFIAIMFLYISS